MAVPRIKSAVSAPITPGPETRAYLRTVDYATDAVLDFINSMSAHRTAPKADRATGQP